MDPSPIKPFIQINPINSFIQLNQLIHLIQLIKLIHLIYLIWLNHLIKLGTIQVWLQRVEGEGGPPIADISLTFADAGYDYNKNVWFIIRARFAD